MIIKLSVQLSSDTARGLPQGLLVPEPPNTVHQTFVGLEAPCALLYKPIRELHSSQKAYFFHGDFAGVVSAGELNFSFHFGPGHHVNRSDVFEDFDNCYTRLAGDVFEFLDIRQDAGQSCHAGVHRIVEAVQGKFRYGPRHQDLLIPRTFCSVEVGNCIDINTVLLACLRRTGHHAAYLAGVHFSANDVGAIADGIHCWISTCEDGVQRDWDVAHCIRGHLNTPVDALNPLGGARAAFSYGRGLVFTDAGRSLSAMSHFARPHWVFADGSVQEAETSAELIRRNGDADRLNARKSDDRLRANRGVETCAP